LKWKDDIIEYDKTKSRKKKSVVKFTVESGGVEKREKPRSIRLHRPRTPLGYKAKIPIVAVKPK